MAGFLDHLRAEIQELERSLETDPRFMKLRELRRVCALYETQQGIALSDSPYFGNVRDGAPRKRSVTRAMTSDMEAIVSAAREILTGQPNPVPLRTLYHEIAEARGIRIGGKNPVNNLSAILWRHGFEAIGRSGWRLPQDASQSASADDDPEPNDPEPDNNASFFGAKSLNGSAAGIHGAATR